MEARFKLDAIRRRLLFKKLTYSEAEKEAEPYLKELNENMARVAKRHGKRHYKVGFSKIMR